MAAKNPQNPGDKDILRLLSLWTDAKTPWTIIHSETEPSSVDFEKRIITVPPNNSETNKSSRLFETVRVSEGKQELAGMLDASLEEFRLASLAQQYFVEVDLRHDDIDWRKVSPPKNLKGVVQEWISTASTACDSNSLAEGNPTIRDDAPELLQSYWKNMDAVIPDPVKKSLYTEISNLLANPSIEARRQAQQKILKALKELESPQMGGEGGEPQEADPEMDEVKEKQPGQPGQPSQGQPPEGQPEQAQPGEGEQGEGQSGEGQSQPGQEGQPGAGEGAPGQGQGQPGAGEGAPGQGDAQQGSGEGQGQSGQAQAGQGSGEGQGQGQQEQDGEGSGSQKSSSDESKSQTTDGLSKDSSSDKGPQQNDAAGDSESGEELKDTNVKDTAKPKVLNKEKFNNALAQMLEAAKKKETERAAKEGQTADGNEADVTKSSEEVTAKAEGSNDEGDSEKTDKESAVGKPPEAGKLSKSNDKQMADKNEDSADAEPYDDSSEYQETQIEEENDEGVDVDEEMRERMNELFKAKDPKKDPSVRTKSTSRTSGNTDAGGFGEIPNTGNLVERNVTRLGNLEIHSHLKDNKSQRVMRKPQGSTDKGQIPVRWENYADGGRVFQYRRKGGTILIDCSWMLHQKYSALQAVQKELPAMNIAVYTGIINGMSAGATGRICILVEDGKWADLSTLESSYGDDVNIASLKWLAKQKGPRVWLSNCTACEGLVPLFRRKETKQEAYTIATASKIVRIDNTKDVIKYFRYNGMKRMPSVILPNDPRFEKPKGTGLSYGSYDKDDDWQSDLGYLS